jgi:hypothetical protein
MRFPELDPYRSELPKLSGKLSEVEGFLSEVFSRRTPGVFDHAAHDIRPVQVANRLEVDEGLALVLLYSCERAGIIDHRYDLYCPVTDLVIDHFSSKSKLPPSIRCPFEISTEHSIDDYLVELVFHFAGSFIERHVMDKAR